jgi:hypothetical protein
MMAEGHFVCQFSKAERLGNRPRLSITYRTIHVLRCMIKTCWQLQCDEASIQRKVKKRFR